MKEILINLIRENPNLQKYFEDLDANKHERYFYCKDFQFYFVESKQTTFEPKPVQIIEYEAVKV